jgi:hypothetical protein
VSLDVGDNTISFVISFNHIKFGSYCFCDSCAINVTDYPSRSSKEGIEKVSIVFKATITYFFNESPLK